MKEAATVLVTGSSRGLGRGIALELARRGFSVAVHYVHNAEAAQSTTAECLEVRRHEGQRFPIVRGNLSEAADRQSIVETAFTALDGIDALINNAGIAVKQRTDLLDATEDSWDEVLDVNLKAPHFLTQLVARRWLERPNANRIASGYKLAFVGSISAEAMSIDRTEYCVSKAGLAVLNRSWALRLAPAGIQSVEIRAGIMATDMTASVQGKYNAILENDQVVPQARWGTPEDMGLAAAAFLEGQLPFSTGDVLNVDGGFHLRRL